MEQGGSQTIKFPLNSQTGTASNSGSNENNIGNGNMSVNTHSNSVAIYSSDLVIEVGPTAHTSGSSAVASKNITKYPWEQLYIPGNLVSVHCSDNFIAYAIKAPKTKNGMVRIVCRSTGVRGLIKTIPGLVTDIAFAYLTARILLGFTDQYGTLFVYEIHEEEDALRTELLLEVKRNDSEEASEYQRLIWCPFIPDLPTDEEDPEDGDEENFAYLLVATNGPVAVIWQVATIVSEYGSGLIDQTRVKPGPGRHYVMEQHSAPIIDAAFSPDGTALATAALDGYVKFFQVYLVDDQSSPRCLHQWNPHDGRPLSCLFFLDNHKNPSPDVQFWKYAVTGACNNSEIKVWSCETWQCNQTISFEGTDELNLMMPTLSLKAAIDPSSKYLILSDIHRRVLYVFILCQEPLPSSLNLAANGCTLESSSHIQNVVKVGIAKVISVTELPIQYPAISLSITSAEWKPYKRWKHEHLMQDNVLDYYDEDDDGNDNMDIVDGLVFKCVLINTQSLQDAVIRFQPTLPVPSSYNPYFGVISNMNISSSQDSVLLRDGLTDLSLSTSIVEGESLSQRLSLGNKSMDSMEKAACLISFPSKSMVGSQSLPVSPSISTGSGTSVVNTLSSMTVKDVISPLKLETSIPPLSIARLSTPSNFDNSKVSEPVTMNLLTLESFSSSGRIEEIETVKVDSDHVIENKETSKRTPTPSEELKSAALSLLMRSRPSSLSRIDSSDSSAGHVTTPKHQDIIPNILDTAVAGSSLSPTLTTLPPPPRTGPSPLPDKEDAPLATSEVSPLTIGITTGASGSPFSLLTSNSNLSAAIQIPHNGSVVGLASSTSSPSLEVQQILHSHNNKNEEDYEDEMGEEGHEIELALITKAGIHSEEYLPTTPPASLLQKPIQTNSHSILLSTSCSLLSKPPPLDSLPKPPPSDSLPLPTVSKSISSHTSSASLHHPTSSNIGGKQVEQPRLQNLININANSTSSKIDMQKNSSQSPLIDMFGGGMKFQQVCQYDNDALRKVSLIDQNEIEISYKKTQEDIASLRQLILSCDSEQEERSQILLDQSKSLASQMDKSMKNIHQLIKQMDDVRKTQSRLQEQLPQLLINSTKPIIENAVRQEVRSALTPALNKCLDPLKNQLLSDVRNLVSNSESHISDGLSKTIYSRSFIDSINNSVSNALTAGVQTACRDAYNKIVLPGFNAATQQVFSQLNEAFTKGTKEYMRHVENESQTTKTACLEHITKSTRNLDSSANMLTAHTNTLVETLHKSITQQTSLSDTLGERLRILVHDETVRALQEHNAAIEARPSRAQTPAPPAHTPINPKVAQQQVQNLISQGQFNSAFKQALSASDLSLVVFVCERINPQQLFSQTPCPLTQDVLLSLVNQLAHDLSTFTDLKTKYLEESVVNLDTNHPVTREHMRIVFQGVQSSLTSHLAQNPNHKKLKMLLMAVNHLVAAQS